LVAIHDKLLTVGGVIRAPWYIARMQTTNKLFVFDKKSNQWKKYNQMHTPRANATSVSYEDKLIITGGCDMCHVTCNKILSNTELLDTSLNQWFTTCSDLPQAHYYLQPVVVGNLLYLLGGVNQDGNSSVVYTASLDTLSQHRLNWKATQDTPCFQSGAANLHETSLLVVGGYNRVYCTSNVYAYEDTTHSWKVTSQIPGAIGLPCVATTKDNVIVVIGGKQGDKTKQNGRPTNSVWIGSLDSNV